MMWQGQAILQTCGNSEGNKYFEAWENFYSPQCVSDQCQKNSKSASQVRQQIFTHCDLETNLEKLSAWQEIHCLPFAAERNVEHQQD